MLTPTLPYGLYCSSHRHRSYLVSRCAAAAAVLFSPPAQAQGAEQAAAALSTWNTAGLERLFMDLYQVHVLIDLFGQEVCVQVNLWFAAIGKALGFGSGIRGFESFLPTDLCVH
jgi:hypothetical protein